MNYICFPLFAILFLSMCLFSVQNVSSQTQFVPNYDEAKAGAYTLPDPLVRQNGARVNDARAWRARRAELLELFATHVYGRTPKTASRIRFVETKRDAQSLGGLAVRKEVTISLLGNADSPQMQLLLYVPTQRTRPAPVFLGLNFNGNHSISDDPTITLSTAWFANDREGRVVNHRATEKTRGREASRWPLEVILARGYAVATIYAGDLFPDHANGLPDSIIPHLYAAGQTAPKADDWNAIGAWAWGLSRALDYLERDKDVDAKRVAVMGHSRMGKATLWAGAQDERFAIVIANESGEGGAALARRNFGETVERINTSFPHWFCANFKKYNHDVMSLPTDQHELIALIAPRPVYIASAEEDRWADPRGEFLSAKGADAVYRLLGADGLGATEMPGVHQPIHTTIGYHIRAGQHDVTKYDWEQYLTFADKHLRRNRR